MRTPARASISFLAFLTVFLTRAPEARGQPFAGAPEPPPGFVQAVLTDPTLGGMPAYVVIYPSKWHYDGILWQGPPCNPIPGQVFRVTSPDGLTMVERMPALSWKWGENLGIPDRVEPGCLPVRRVLSPSEVNRALATILRVEFVGDAPIPDGLRDRAVALSQNSRPGTPEMHVEYGWADVKFTNGTYVMKGRLETEVTCFRSTTWRGQKPPWINYSCMAGTRYTVAPEGQLDQVLTDMQKTAAIGNQAWVSAVNQRTTRAYEQFDDAMNNITRDNIARINDDARRHMAISKMESDYFNRQLQQSTQSSIAQSEALSAREHTVAQDYVDYSLGQRTVRDQETGAIAKVPAGTNYVWRNGTGNYFGTLDPNVNPNGTLQGSWSRQSFVHGDGTQ